MITNDEIRILASKDFDEIGMLSCDWHTWKIAYSLGYKKGLGDGLEEARKIITNG